MDRTAGAYRTHHKRECTPSFTMETYDRHGRIQKVELLRTLSFEEWTFELERSQLPVADVTYESEVYTDG